MSYTLRCAIIGHTEVIPLEVKETWSIGHIKNHLKALETQTLASFNASGLKLYKVDINIAERDIRKKVMQQIHQGSIKFDREEAMDGADDVSEYWELSKLSRRTIHILVELPLRESIDSMDPKVSSPSPMFTSATVVIPLTPVPDNLIERDLLTITTDLREMFKTFLENNVQLPLWQLPSELAKDLAEETRSHITGLKIPTISSSSESEVPSLLLHNLGKPSHDAKLVDRISKLFSPKLG